MWSICSYLQAQGFSPRPISPFFFCSSLEKWNRYMQGREYSSGFFKKHSAFKPFVQVRNQQLQGPREQPISLRVWNHQWHLNAKLDHPGPKSATQSKVFTVPVKYYCTRSRMQHRAEGQHKAYATLKSHSILWDLNDTSTSCWPFTQASGLAYVLGAEAFKESEKSTGTNRCQAYNGLRL